MALRHFIQYQGKPCVGVSFRRGEGLDAEGGWVEMGLETLGKIDIVPRDMPWRSTQGIEVSGCMNFRGWKILQSQTTAVTELPALPAASGGGLNIFGDLILTTLDGETELSAPMIYKDVYVDTSGLEEVIKGLAFHRKHNLGRLRIPLTDIRKWWPESGGVFCAVNRRLPGGKPDKQTLGPNDIPGTLKDVVSWLLSQLRGSPRLAKGCDLYEDPKFPEPWNVVDGEGESPKEWLTRVVDKFALVPRLLPGNGMAMDRRPTVRVVVGQLPTGGDDLKTLGTNENGGVLREESRTTFITNRPPMVMVIGKRVMERMTLKYVPVFQDLDGRIYELIDPDDDKKSTALETLWGYSLAQARAHVLNGEEKNFRDIPPTIDVESEEISAGDVALHERRRAVAQEWFYRAYLPAAVFEQSSLVDGEGLRYVTEDIYDRLPFLPMDKYPAYESELANLSITIPSGVERQDGDLDDKAGEVLPFVLVDPQVSARTIGQRFFTDFPALKAYFDRQFKRQEIVIQTWLEFEQKMGQLIAAKGKQLLLNGDIVDEQKLIDKYGADYIAANFEKKKLAAHEQSVLDAAGAAISAQDTPIMGALAVNKAVSDDAWGLVYKVAAWQKNLEAAGKEAQNEISKLEQMKNDFDEKIVGSFETIGGVKLECVNIPYSPLKRGYTLDLKTGLLRFQKPACSMVQLFVMSGDTANVDQDGGVTVTFAHERRTNSTLDWTAILFGVEPNVDENPKVILTEVGAATAIKPRIERAPEMRLYVDERGTPFNLNACVSQAAPHAFEILRQARVQIGHVGTWSGFRRAILDAGVSFVEHLWAPGLPDAGRTPDDEASVARTRVAIQSPFGRTMTGGPLLSASFGYGTNRTVTIRVRDEVRRERSDSK